MAVDDNEGTGLWLKPKQACPSSSETVLTGLGVMLAWQWVVWGKDPEFKMMTVTCGQDKTPDLCKEQGCRGLGNWALE